MNDKDSKRKHNSSSSYQQSLPKNDHTQVLDFSIGHNVEDFSHKNNFSQSLHPFTNESLTSDITYFINSHVSFFRMFSEFGSIIDNLIGCRNCNKQFQNASEFVDHLVSFHFQDLIPILGQSNFNLHSELHSHSAQLSKQQKESHRLIHCPKCDNKFSDSTQYGIHLIQTHIPQPQNLFIPYKINISSSHDLSSPNEYLCAVCGALLYENSRLIHYSGHIPFLEQLINMSGGRYSCPRCPTIFSSFEQYALHVLTKHFNCERLLSSHAYKQGKIIHCFYCNSEIDSKTFLNHFVFQHPLIVSSFIDSYLKCFSPINHHLSSHFSSLFVNPIQLNEEIKTDSELLQARLKVALIPSISRRAFVGKDGERFFCLFCGTNFASRDDIILHLTTKHKSESEAYISRYVVVPQLEDVPAVCHICCHPFPNFSSYAEHFLKQHSKLYEILAKFPEYSGNFAQRRIAQENPLEIRTFIIEYLTSHAFSSHTQSSQQNNQILSPSQTVSTLNTNQAFSMISNKSYINNDKSTNLNFQPHDVLFRKDVTTPPSIYQTFQTQTEISFDEFPSVLTQENQQCNSYSNPISNYQDEISGLANDEFPHVISDENSFSSSSDKSLTINGSSLMKESSYDSTEFPSVLKKEDNLPNN